MIHLRRAYEPASPTDGQRVLVDRLWPRGLRKDAAHLDAWLKDLAPSDELRRWFGHEPTRFAEFRQRYKRELKSEPARAALDELVRRAAREPVTLVFSAHDEQHNNAVVLAAEIEQRLRRGGAARRPARDSRSTPGARPAPSSRTASRRRSRARTRR